MADNVIEVDRGAASLAGFAFMETPGPDALKLRAALWAYDWARANTKPWGKEGSGMRAYPSLNDLRAALAAVPAAGEESNG